MLRSIANSSEAGSRSSVKLISAATTGEKDWRDFKEAFGTARIHPLTKIIITINGKNLNQYFIVPQSSLLHRSNRDTWSNGSNPTRFFQEANSCQFP